MENDFLVGVQPHVAVDGDYIRVAVILKEEGLWVSRGSSTREMAQLHSLTNCGFVPGEGWQRTGDKDGGEGGGHRGWGCRGWLEDKAGIVLIYLMLQLKLCVTGCIPGTEL